MPSNALLEKLRAGKVVLGVSNMYPASGIIEGMCRGWDFVWIDAQHGQHRYETVLGAIHSAHVVGVDPMVRVPSYESGTLGLYADLAPSAIMIPMVNTAEEARAIVTALRFPPLGQRSFGGRRVIDLNGREYYREAELIVIVQIETLQAVENASAIIATEGIDMLFFGPDDMKVQLGIAINTPVVEHEPLRAIMQRVAEAAKTAGKFCGMPCRSPRAAKMVIEMGYQLVAGGNDAMFLREGAARAKKELTAVAQESAPTRQAADLS